MTLGEKISSLRKAGGLSQEDLAITLGVSRQAVSKWELGAAMPDIDKVVALADHFGVTTDWLLRDVAPQAAPASVATPSSSARAEAIAPMLLCALLGVCAAGLLLLLYGRFVSASALPALCGLLLQLLAASFAMGFGLYLRGRGLKQSGIDFIRAFWRVGVWLVAPLPLTRLAALAVQLVPAHLWEWLWLRLPTALAARAYLLFPLPGAACYVLGCTTVTLLLRKTKK